ncbi:universal stress protein [Pseudonocardia sp. T1-2H]|uniref:universal stress protein n=1 Tax=Pseudonocardia sp. T1-2H TaxID=3128899 RepID=UPI0031016762
MTTSNDVAGSSVVVGADGSPGALAAVRWAAREARRRKAKLRLVAVVDWAADPARTAAAADVLQRYREHLHCTARAQLREATDMVRSLGPLPTVQCVVRDGAAADVLGTESDEAELLLVGLPRSGEAGPLVAALVGRASCPVVVVGPAPAQQTAPTSPVVVGVDGSAANAAALAQAFEEARSHGVPLVAAHAWTDATMRQSSPTLSFEAVLADARELLESRLAPWTATYPDVHVRRLVARDSAATVLAERSTNALLVVLGSDGWRAPDGYPIGEVGRALLSRARCPVMLVRDGLALDRPRRSDAGLRSTPESGRSAPPAVTA